MKIMVAPQKMDAGLTHNLATITRLQPLVVGFTEMDLGHKTFIPQIRTGLGPTYEVVSSDIGVHSEEIPVAIRTGPHTEVERFKVLSISPDVGERGWGNDRYLVVVRFRHRDRTYVVMHTHTDAVIQNLHTGVMFDNIRVDVTAKAMQAIEDRAKAELKDPDVTALWIMGDFNYLPPTDPSILWKHSPPAVFDRLGMKWVHNRVIYLAWSPGVSERRQVTQILAMSERNASDHTWLVGHFRREKADP
jgi:hypothetical protein